MNDSFDYSTIIIIGFWMFFTGIILNGSICGIKRKYKL